MLNVSKKMIACLSLVFAVGTCFGAASSSSALSSSGSWLACSQVSLVKKRRESRCPSEKDSYEGYRMEVHGRTGYFGHVDYGVKRLEGMDAFGVIRFLSVRVEKRNQGYGSLLLQTAMCDLEKQGVVSVDLVALPMHLTEESENWDEAVERLKRYYERFGFEEHIAKKVSRWARFKQWLKKKEHPQTACYMVARPPFDRVTEVAEFYDDTAS